MVIQARQGTFGQSNEDVVPDMAQSLRDLGEWLTTLSTVLDRMPQIQRRALLDATRGLRRDLAAIKLGAPEVAR